MCFSRFYTNINFSYLNRNIQCAVLLLLFYFGVETFNKIILIKFRKYEMIFEVQNVLLCKTNVICVHRMDRSGQRGSLYRFFSTLIDFIQFKRGMMEQILLIDWPVRFPGCIKKCSSEITIVFSIPGHVFQVLCLFLL